MTDFKRDVLKCVDLMSCGDLTDFTVKEYPLGFYIIDTGEEVRRYDYETEERIF